jgi:hypothetical protein
MAKLVGTIQIGGLPAHRGLMVDLCFFRVANDDTPAPYNGDPPVEAVTDCERVFEQVDLESESMSNTFEREFAVERDSGFYFVQLRVILFQMHNGKVLAQAENVFFGRRPLHITAEPSGEVTFPVAWPQLSVSELHQYGTFTPKSRRPWWRFW